MQVIKVVKKIKLFNGQKEFNILISKKESYNFSKYVKQCNMFETFRKKRKVYTFVMFKKWLIFKALVV